MIQFNLLPDVKLEFLKTQRVKRQVIMIAGIASAVALAFIILMYVVIFAQSKHMGDLTKDIKTKSDNIKKTPEIEKILTVQNQLNKLPDLHNNKPALSRIFLYIIKVTPINVSIATLKADYTAGTLEITGSTDKLNSVNKYVDTLKFTDYVITDTKTNEKIKDRAFSNVVMTDFGRDEKGAKYTITLNFNSAIFDINKLGENQNLDIEIPKDFVTTRSQVEKPLFEKLKNPDDQKEAQ